MMDEPTRKELIELLLASYAMELEGLTTSELRTHYETQCKFAAMTDEQWMEWTKKPINQALDF
jgi:hypothetical protein